MGLPFTSLLRETTYRVEWGHCDVLPGSYASTKQKGYFVDFGVVEDWLVVVLSSWTPGFYCWDGWTFEGLEDEAARGEEAAASTDYS